MRNFPGSRWLLAATLLSGAFTACRLRYETLSDGEGGTGLGGASSGGGNSATGGVEAQGASANAGDGNDPGSGGDNTGSGGTTGPTAGNAGEGGSAGTTMGGSAGSGDPGGSSGSGGSSGGGGTGGSGSVGDLIVTTNADEANAGATVAAPGGTGLSLREAITIANATAGAQTITFQNGIVVAQTSALPTIADALTISGGVVNGAGIPNNQDCLLIAAGPTTLDGLELYACRGRPIYVTGGNDVHISNCNVHDNSGPVQTADTAGTGTIIGPGNTIAGSTGHCTAIYNDNALVLDNRIQDCGGVVVFLSGTAANTRVIGNLLLRGTFGISMGSGATGTVMWHNTIAQNSASGVNVGQASPNDLRNNIFALNSIYGVAASDARFTQNDHNLYFGNGSGTCNPCMLGTGSLQSDPLFVNAAGDDFTLQAASPAINAGTPLGVDRNGAAAGDFNGAAPDMGYWESL